ncbi:MAG: mannose-1-phosphate guanylyltransferase/mannose-6-phosphate isomerase [Proteobacteria bacterium]|nr:mannose-1-phosphate guanylyltransferase/mannose-6-phosphate isomerase [Pseudomonadota bacterium]
MAEIVHPVILSGGAGTRLWPVSRTLYPKQLLPLVSERTMLQETVRRVAGKGFAPPVVVCNEEHRFLIAGQLRELDIAPSRMVLEPVGRNTAPAAAVAALLLAGDDADAVMLLLPSDHVIEDVSGFLAAVETGLAAAENGALVTFGIPPTGPETGYGYIRRGAAYAGAKGCFRIARFVEKPDLEEARRLVRAGDYHWNSGMFLVRAGRYLEELERLKPEMVECCRRAVAGAVEDLDFLRLEAEAFSGIEPLSIDYAVMEHTEAAVVVPADMGWSDVGSWSALWEIGAKDGDGNVVLGDVITDGTTDSYIRSEGRLVAALGLDNVVVVATDDVVLVVRRDEAQNVKKVVEALARAGRPEHSVHTKVYRPWGYYQSIDAGDRFQVKRLHVNPGQKLSLQMHHHRAEHWVVVSGTAKVTRGDETFLLNENESTYLPLGVKHALENPGDAPLCVIEVQSGDYLGEDDIVRFEDRYGRVPAAKAGD